MMKICTSVSSQEELGRVPVTDLAEVDAKTFQQMVHAPERQFVVRVENEEQIVAVATEKLNGYINVGGFRRPKTQIPVISTFRDDNRTMSSSEIVGMAEKMDCEIAMFMFHVNRPADLVAIKDASELIERKHVLIGTGEMGSITGFRPRKLGNEFAYTHAGTPVYSGQLSNSEYRALGSDPIIFGLIGHPLTRSASKTMHTKALSDFGMNGRYVNFDTVSLDGMDDVIRDYDIKGLNVTLPYKDDMMEYIDSADMSAEQTGAVSTILNTGNKLIGSNTDVDGLRFAMDRAGVSVDAGMKILVIGSGGFAMSCCYLFTSKGAEVSIVGRSEKTVNKLCRRFGCTATKNADVSGYDMIVNCTPIGMYSHENYPIDLTTIKNEQTILDVVYTNETRLEAVGREHGCTIIHGLDVLIGHGIKSFEIWTGRKPDYDSLKSSLLSSLGATDLE